MKHSSELFKRNRDADGLPLPFDGKNKRVKEYNFKNPDKFSKEHLRLLGSVHELFCRQANMSLNATLRMQTELSVQSVQQLTYADYLTDMQEDMVTAVMTMYPFVTEFAVGMDKELIGMMIDRLLGGAGDKASSSGKARDEFTDVEVGICKDMLRKILRFIPEGWQMLIPTASDIEMNSLEFNPHSAQIVPPTDIIALITIDLKVGDYDGAMRICVPYSALEDVISNLNRQSAYKNERVDDDERARDLILNRLSTTDLDVEIVLARGQLMMSEIMGLQVGDIVKLDTKPDELSEIWIANELKFYGSPGQVGNKYSVTVIDHHVED